MCELEPLTEDYYKLESDLKKQMFGQDHDEYANKAWRLSPPTRFGPKYKDELAASSNVNIFLNSNVTQLYPEKDGKTIKSVKITSNAETYFKIKAKKYVLPCGGLENPQDVLAFQGEHCLVKGKRRGRPLLDGMFTFGMQLVSFFYLKQYLDDINAQPKVFHRSFFETFRKSAPHDFSLDLHLLYLAKVSGLDIQSIDVTFEDRVHGEAKGGGSFKTKWKLIKRTLSYISELAQERARA